MLHDIALRVNSMKASSEPNLHLDTTHIQEPKTELEPSDVLKIHLVHAALGEAEIYETVHATSATHYIASSMNFLSANYHHNLGQDSW